MRSVENCDCKSRHEKRVTRLFSLESGETYHFPAQIADEQAKTILPLKEARVVSFLKNYTEIVKCADKAESLDNMKRLFDVFIKEVIFDGERFLIVMKTTNEPLDPEKRQKEEATRKKFEMLRFGENTVINENTAFVIKNRVAFVVIMNNPKSDSNRV